MGPRFPKVAIASVMAIFLSSCASMTIRSGEPPAKDLVFGATRMDLGMLWENGVRGDPVFQMAPAWDSQTGVSSPKADPLTRAIVAFGCLFDLPFSLVSDTLFLPFDLLWPEQTEPAKMQGE